MAKGPEGGSKRPPDIRKELRVVTGGVPSSDGSDQVLHFRNIADPTFQKMERAIERIKAATINFNDYVQVQNNRADIINAYRENRAALVDLVNGASEKDVDDDPTFWRAAVFALETLNKPSTGPKR